MSRSTDASPPRTIYLIKRAETAVRTGLEARLQGLAVTPAQYITLSLLKGQPDQSSAELARRAGVTPQSMSETIAVLTRKALIARVASPEHKRILMTRLTTKGEMLLLDCDRLVDALEAQMLAGMGVKDLALLRRTLRSIARAR